MRVRGALADYQVDYRATTTYLLVESNGLPYWRDDTILIAFEANSGISPNKYGATSSHLIIRVKTDKLYDLWMKLIPAYGKRWINPKVSVIANVATYLRATCLLLRRGLALPSIMMDERYGIHLQVTSEEEEMVQNAWNAHPDLHGKLTTRAMEKRSDGVITVFEEGYGLLEDHGSQWLPYKDACLLAACGESLYDLISEYSGQSPDVIRDVLNGLQTTIVESMRMGVSLGLSSMSMQVPFVGRIEGTAFFSQARPHYATQVTYEPDLALRTAVETALNIVYPYYREFAPRLWHMRERTETDGSKKENNYEEADVSSDKEQGKSRDVNSGRVVFINGGDAADLLPSEDESYDGEEVYSDGYDPWDEDDAEFQGSAGEEGID